MIKSLLLALVCCAALASPALFWFNQISARPAEEPVETLTLYLKNLYARDFRQAYPFLASSDRRLKSLKDYVQERGEFTGFALDVARHLARRMAIRPLSSEMKGSQNHLRVGMTLPDANGIAKLLLDWDEQKLNALSTYERTRLLAKIDELASAGRLPMIEGEEKFVLIEEGSKWKVFVDWAAGTRVQFATTMPPGQEVVAAPLTRQTVARSGDPFSVEFNVRNSTDKEIMTRIVHRVEPKAVAQYLELVECALLLPVRLRPGEAQNFRSTYLIRGDLPDGIKNLNITYEFRIENR